MSCLKSTAGFRKLYIRLSSKKGSGGVFMAKRGVKKLNFSGGGMNRIGGLFFVLGALIAILGGIVYPGSPNASLSTVLIVLGIIVGLLNVTMKEAQAFLLATASLVVVTALGGAVLGDIAFIGAYVAGVLHSVLTFVVPASIIVALKAVYVLAED